MQDEGIVATRRESLTIWHPLTDARLGRLFGILYELSCKRAKIGRST